MNDRILDHRILDLCLEEAVGSARPPDLSDKIMRALANCDLVAGAKGAAPVHSPAPIPLGPIVTPVTVAPVTVAIGQRRASAASFNNWLPLALAASLLMALGGYWMMRADAVRRPVAAGQFVDRPLGSRPAELVKDQSAADADLRYPASGAVSVAGSAAPVAEIDSSTAGHAQASLPVESESSLASSAPKTSAGSDGEVIAVINAAIQSRWKEAGVRPSPPATESEWCRRVYLDCIGRIPTVAELEAFLIDNARNKRAKLVERLLEDDRYIENYARFWTTIWTNLLIGRTGGMAPNSPVNREGLRQYLRRAFLSNEPYNQMVYELISARGSDRPGDDDYNGAVNFLLAHLEEKAAPATAKAARVFLGMQATFVDGTAIGPSGRLSVVDRRRELARSVIRSDEMKLAIVNRLWAHFLGYGFTKPVDDLSGRTPPSHPDLLTGLAEEFAGHGYDLRRLIRWIALSDAYGLSSKFGTKLGNAADDPSAGAAPLFSHFYVRQMSAEQLYDSLLVAAGVQAAPSGVTGGRFEDEQRLKDRWLEQFAIAFGADENDEATTFGGTIAQTLVMMNGDLTRLATSGETGGFLSQVSKRADRQDPLNDLYLAALARRPSRGEAQAANRLLSDPSAGAAAALEDIWWALLNSNEFILNH